MKDAWQVWGLLTWAVHELSDTELGDAGLVLAGLPLAVLQFAPPAPGPQTVSSYAGVSGRVAVGQALALVQRWEPTLEVQELLFDLVDVNAALSGGCGGVA